MSWARLFEDTPDNATVAEIQTALEECRAETRSDDGTGDESTASEPLEATPLRVVADADVLAADCCVGGPSRAVLDELYEHSWMTLIASDQLLADAQSVIETVANPSVATAWRERIAEWRQPVEHPLTDHPALGSAYRGGAMHVLSFDDELTSSAAGATLNTHVSVSIRRPEAFRLLFDPERLYAVAHDDQYPGPDRRPRV